MLLTMAVLTVSDSRTKETDKLGKALVARLTEAGHSMPEKIIVPDNIYKIRKVVSRWITDDSNPGSPLPQLG